MSSKEFRILVIVEVTLAPMKNFERRTNSSATDCGICGNTLRENRLTSVWRLVYERFRERAEAQRIHRAASYVRYYVCFEVDTISGKWRMEFAELLCLNLSLSYTFERVDFPKLCYLQEGLRKLAPGLWEHGRTVDVCAFSRFRGWKT